jgi:hypothetical protein
MQEKNNTSSKRSDERKGSTRKNIRFEDDLLSKIDEDRAKTNQAFSEWVKDACEKKLKPKSTS